MGTREGELDVRALILRGDVRDAGPLARVFPHDITPSRQRTTAGSAPLPPHPSALSSRGRAAPPRTPIPPDAGLRSRDSADLAPRVVLLPTRVWEDTRGTRTHTCTWALPAPCAHRGQRSGGGLWAPIPPRFGKPLFYFPPLTSGPAAHRGGDPAVRGAHPRRGRGRGGEQLGAAARRSPAGSCRCRGARGEPEASRARPRDLFLMRSWKLLGGELYFYLHVKRSRCQRGKGDPGERSGSSDATLRN